MDAPYAKAEEMRDPITEELKEGPLTQRFRELKDDPHRAARGARWQEENAGAIAAYNAWFEAEGHQYLRRPLF